MLLFHIQPYISTWTSSDLLDEPSGAFKTSSFRHFLQKSIFSGVASEPFSSFQPVLHVYICPFLFFSSISSERASKRASIQLRISSTPSVPSAPSDLFCTFQCIATVFFFPAKNTSIYRSLSLILSHFDLNNVHTPSQLIFTFRSLLHLPIASAPFEPFCTLRPLFASLFHFNNLQTYTLNDLEHTFTPKYHFGAYIHS